MAVIGPISSPAPNVLFNPMGVHQAAQQYQRNNLLMEQGREDQAAQQFQRDAAARIGMARELAALPEAEAAAQWGPYRARIQAAGLGAGLPEQFPGMARLQAVASSDITAFQRMQIEAQRENAAATRALQAETLGLRRQELGQRGALTAYQQWQIQQADADQRGKAAMFGPGAGAPPAPGAGVSPPPGDAMYGRNAGRVADREHTLDNPPAMAERSSQVAAASGLPTGAAYRANPGVVGQNAGLPPPTGAVPVMGGEGPAPAAPAAAAAPGGLVLDPPGTPAWAPGTTAEDQRRLRAMAASRTVTAEELLRTAGQMAAANRAAQFQQGTAARADRLEALRLQQDAAAAEQRRVENERAGRAEALRLRQEERRLRLDELKQEREGPAGTFAGNGIDAAVYNSLLRLAPKIEDGTATPAEVREYGLAHRRVTSGTQQMIDNGQGGQVLAQVPGAPLDGFPVPRAPARAADPAPAPDAPAVDPAAPRPIPGTTRGAPLPPTTVVNGMLENAAALSKIDEGLEELSQPRAAGSTGPGPAVVGSIPLVGNRLLNSGDPGGVRLRAIVADIGSMKIHDRSGAAVSVAEFPRLAPFVPGVNDTAAEVRTKLELFRREYEQMLRETYEVFGPAANGRALAPVDRALSRRVPGAAPAPVASPDGWSIAPVGGR